MKSASGQPKTKNVKQFNYQSSKLKSAIQFAIVGLSFSTFSNVVTAEEQATETISLKEISVVGKNVSDTKPVKGYNAKKSRTATRTETDLKDTPQSISVVTQDVIRDQSIQSISEAVRYVPGVTASQGEGNRDAINFRGAGVTTGDFYQDGVRDDIQTYRDLYNTDRIEILRGSNAMIFGRGGSGGVINRVSKEAGWDPVRELSMSYGAYNQKRATIDIGDAINEVAAFRLNAVYEDSDSYRDGVNLERYGLTPTITIKPSDATKIVLSAEYFKDERIGDRGMPSLKSNSANNLRNRPYNIGDHSTFFGSARLSPNETETTAFNAMIEHAFDNGVTVRNRTRYADYDKYYQNVYARSAVSNGRVELGAYRDDTERRNLINQTDLTYNLKTGSLEHRLLAGMELGRQDTDNTRRSPNAGNDNLAGDVSAENPEFTGTLNLNNLRTNLRSASTNTAFYIQDQIILSPKWEMVLGLRHDRFDVDLTNFNGATPAARNLSATDNKLSPRAGLIFKPLENLSLYASYSQSFVPRSGDQLTSLTVNTASLTPEKFINHEIGAKFDINPDLALTAAVYKLERENIAAASDVPGQSVLIDGQVTKGAELGITGKVTDKWSVFGGYAYQDAELTKNQTIGTSVFNSGAELGQTPKHTFSLWNRYDFSETWGAAIGVITRSDMYALTPTTTSSTVLPGYTRVDAAVYGKLDKNLRLQLNLENLTNKEYALSAHNNNNIVPGSPLTARATLIYNF
jgi:catecholate siderophore receptor